MVNNYQNVCNREIYRINNNVRLILSKGEITNEDLGNLNDYYNELDYYNYYKNYRRFNQMLMDDYDYE